MTSAKTSAIMYLFLVGLKTEREVLLMNGQNPYAENLENVLEKYGRDIVQDVKDGKIDPVIGRDEEIRSITRIL